MTAGPGKYDVAASNARLETLATGVVLMVINGVHGHGFSVQVRLEDLPGLPALLRTMADEIERDMKGDTS
jgi:hypothetical protein